MTTHIHFILDRSGSMWEINDDTIGGFNSFIEEQKKNNDNECYMSLYQFDHEYQIIYKNKKISDIENLNNDTFIPRGQTALFDAIGRTVNNIINEENVKNIVVILTDGFENASNEFTHNNINTLIKNKEKENIEFVFLGANQDALKTASNLGINTNSAMTYAQTPENVRACFSGLSSAISRTRSGSTEQISFTKVERNNSKN
jgi:uncharacterized protein YegL